MLIIVFAVFSFAFPFYIVQRIIKFQEIQKQVLGVVVEKEKQGMPKRLIIPKIGVDTAIQYVGVEDSGEMETPTNTVDVGWFSLGPRPGEKGSAVIAGHFNGKDGSAAVFNDLDKLREGDKIYVQDDEGEYIVFVVKESHMYDPGFAEEVFSSVSGSSLNLITCDGVWNDAKKSFSKRLVVFSDIVNYENNK